LEQLLASVEEAARAIGVSRAYAYELIASGQLPSVQLGRRRLVPTRALSEWVDRMASATRLATDAPKVTKTQAKPAMTGEVGNRYTPDEARRTPRGSAPDDLREVS
jgi:excisionase family DNA binding protein